MPPKKDNAPPKQAKAAADKTFGMKNKKGGAAQRQIKQIQAQVASAKSPEEKKKQAEKEAREKEKKAADDAARETAELFKPVQVQKVPFGVDPKSVVCQFFKKGHCDKGKKCKFSHDLAAERKGEKKSLYTDTRGDGEEGEGGDGEEGAADKNKEDMTDWDEEKLRSVVMSKHGNLRTTTDKVCKFFIEAVENGKYGWFWTCPNGGDECKYKHSLPPGFVLKTKEQRAAEKALMDRSPMATLTLEDFLESERHKLTGNLTPVTPETFAVWKKNRVDKKVAEEEARKKRDESGRALFEAGGWEVDEDDEEGDSDDDDDSDGVWNIEAMRRETENAQEAREVERLRKQYGGDAGGAVPQMNGNGSHAADAGADEDESSNVDETDMNGVADQDE